MKKGGEGNSPKGTWFVVFAAFIWLEILLTTFGSYLAINYVHSKRAAPGATELRSLAYIVAPLAVVAALYWARAKLAGASERSPQEFTRDSVVALGIAELGMM